MASQPQAETQAKYVIVGAGIHGLSTAWHLAQPAQGQRPGRWQRCPRAATRPASDAGASGVACGVVRNNYFQPAMRELMAHSVGVWESDPEAFAYHGVGYLQIAPEAMRADVVQIAAEQKAIGYDSVLIEGVDECRAYLLDMFSDWQAPGISVVLHEKRGGYANNTASLRGLAAKARS
ncbi:MAG: FAD-dependent oxidoreductase [Geodermatophilaceae bacterium]